MVRIPSPSTAYKSTQDNTLQYNSAIVSYYIYIWDKCGFTPIYVWIFESCFEDFHDWTICHIMLSPKDASHSHRLTCHPQSAWKLQTAQIFGWCPAPQWWTDCPSARNVRMRKLPQFSSLHRVSNGGCRSYDWIWLASIARLLKIHLISSPLFIIFPYSLHLLSPAFRMSRSWAEALTVGKVNLDSSNLPNSLKASFSSVR